MTLPPFSFWLKAGKAAQNKATAKAIKRPGMPQRRARSLPLARQQDAFPHRPWGRRGGGGWARMDRVMTAFQCAAPRERLQAQYSLTQNLIDTGARPGGFNRPASMPGPRRPRHARFRRPE